MDLEKTKLMNDLIDLYGVLLTENQLRILEYYYMDDLSLSEISENLSITRSAVSDSLNKSSKALLEYEEKLGLLKKENKKRDLISRIDELKKEQIVSLLEDL